MFGSTVLDLTDREEDPLSLADGFEPVRHRLGIAYEDECLELGVTWRRDYETHRRRPAGQHLPVPGGAEGIWAAKAAFSGPLSGSATVYAG